MTTVTVAAGTVSAGTGRAPGIPARLTPEGAQAVFRATLDALARPGTVKRLPSADGEPLAGHVPAALLPLLALADLSTPVCVVDHAAGAGGDHGAAEAPVTGSRAEYEGGAALDRGNGPDGGSSGRTAWDEIVRVATNAPRAALGDARLVAALRPLSAVELASLRTGTTTAPEDGALACLAVAGIATVEGADTADVADGADEADGSGNGAGSDADGGESGSTTGDGRRLWLRLSGPGVPGMRAVIVTGLPAGFAAARRRLVAGFPAGADLLLIAPDGAMTGLPRTTEVHEEAV